MAQNQGNQSNKQHASTGAIQDHLGGIDYPVNKQKLIEHARNDNAPEDVISVLQRIEDREYDSPVDVNKAVGEIE